jgi:monofunctional glycosyltransferase
MHNIWLCHSGKDYVALEDVSPYFIQSLVISEDGSFYKHKGFDLQELRNSFIENLKSFKYKRGGSTISQQLVKNYFLTGKKSLLRKLKEAYLTYLLEKNFSKNEILEKYINLVDFGREIFGLQSAAHLYFNTTPSQLSLAQSIVLVYLLPSPTLYSQVFRTHKFTKYSKTQCTKILDYLFKFNKITEEEYTLAKVDLETVLNLDNPEYIQYVKSIIEKNEKKKQSKVTL